MFINKSLLVPENSRRLAFVKGMTLFFLGASATLLVANGLQIEPNLTQATTSILQKILLVGGDNVATGVYLDGPNSKISAKTICTVDGVHCVDTSQISSGGATATSAVDMSEYYKKGEVDTNINALSGWLTNTYIPGVMATSNTFSAANYYTKGEIYTTGQVNNIISVLTNSYRSKEISDTRYLMSSQSGVFMTHSNFSDYLYNSNTGILREGNGPIYYKTTVIDQKISDINTQIMNINSSLVEIISESDRNKANGNDADTTNTLITCPTCDATTLGQIRICDTAPNGTVNAATPGGATTKLQNLNELAVCMREKDNWVYVFPAGVVLDKKNYARHTIYTP